MNNNELFPKPNPFADNPFVRWMNKLLAGCLACVVKDSADIKVRRDKVGTYLTLTENLKNIPRVRYSYDRLYTRIEPLTDTNKPDFNYFDPKDSYNIGDIVRVDKPWYAGKDPVKTSDDVYILQGIYMCVQTVPPWIEQGNIPSASVLLVDNLNRQSDIIYAPLYPEPFRLASRNVFTPDTVAAEDYRTYQGRYWEWLSFFPEKAKFCIDGPNGVEVVEVYASMAQIPSGSAGMRKLPGVP